MSVGDGAAGAPPADANLAQLWGRLLMEELARAGVDEVCVAPGSRSTPLVFAAVRVGLRPRVFLDERSAAFFALGLGKSTGRPAAVITTSGTAVANLLPAAVEAAQSETPLLLVTADRPRRLRDADANQAIRQAGIFDGYARESWDLPLPSFDPPVLRYLRSVGARAAAAAAGLPGGPVHLNVPFEKPLEPTDVGGEPPAEVVDREVVRGRGADEVVAPAVPWTDVARRIPTVSEGEVARLAEVVDAAERPLLVVGAHPQAARLAPVALRFAAAAGMPVLGDPLSGTRFHPGYGTVRTAHHDLFVRDPEARLALEPDLVLRLGQAPTSAALLAWLESMDVPQVVVDGGVRWKDHLAAATRVLPADPTGVLEACAERVSPAPGAWRALWREVDAAAAEAIDDAPGPRHEGHLARAVTEAIPEGAALFLSSSMPIRDVDGFSPVRDAAIEVYGNRGASGIDGITSTALGVAAGSGRRTVALVGDLAFLHDANGLLAARETDAEVLFVVVNNDGGGIFHMLPVREFEPEFTRYFATPHGVELGKVAEAWRVPHRTIGAATDLAAVLEEEVAQGGTRVVEIRTERESNRIGHESAVKAVREAVRRLLDDRAGGTS